MSHTYYKKMELYILRLFIVCILYQFNVLVAGNQCIANTDIGTTDCVLLSPYYSEKQWATCLTDTYIREQGKLRNQTHFCRFSRPICWYQCMVEINNLDKGPVYPNCSCDGTRQSVSLPLSTAPTLPNWCYSPDGTSCNWYRDCLEEAKSCAGKESDYAIKYAEKFCELYQQHYRKFSVFGQKWIDLVRRCLQIKLVPLIRKWRDITCKMIRDQAFASHASCYVYPEKDLSSEYSFCNLPPADQWQVFWTIKSGFVQAPVPSIEGLLETIYKCGQRYVMKNYMGLIQFVTELINGGKRRKRSPSTDDTEIGWKIANSVANQFSWDKSGITWYAYLGDDETRNVLVVNILIASKFKLDLNHVDAHEVNLNQTITAVAKAVEMNHLKLPETGVTISSFNGCGDVNCTETYAEVTSEMIRAAKGDINGSNIMSMSSHIIITIFLFLQTVM